jgi:hypothetical protein
MPPTPSDRSTAAGTIAVSVWKPEPYDAPAEGHQLVRVHVEEAFSGDIEAAGTATFIQILRADGSGSFVGVERVTGTLAGREGTFVLQDEGTLADDVVSGSWFVVPGSGTRELAGLRGKGRFRADLGQNAEITLDYWFEHDGVVARGQLAQPPIDEYADLALEA